VPPTLRHFLQPDSATSNGMNEQDGVTPQIDVHGQAVDFQVTMSVPTTFARIAGKESF